MPAESKRAATSSMYSGSKKHGFPLFPYAAIETLREEAEVNHKRPSRRQDGGEEKIGHGQNMNHEGTKTTKNAKKTCTSYTMELNVLHFPHVLLHV
jgi:hypothetical protein